MRKKNGTDTAVEKIQEAIDGIADDYSAVALTTILVDVAHRMGLPRDSVVEQIERGYAWRDQLAARGKGLKQ